jgi:DNA polymerase V
MSNLSRWFPQIDVYSIDEAFGWLGGVSNLHQYVPQIRESVINNTGIPISIGVAPTKTLAKLANKLAKKNNGVLILDTPERIAQAVKDFPVKDLWGVGRQYYQKLKSFGIETADQLREMPELWFKQHMTIMGQRMWNELWGRPALSIDSMPDSRKGVSVSRSFRNYIEEPDILSEAVSMYASRLSEKLRKEKLHCSYLQVFLYTNKHREDHPQHFPSHTHKLSVASNNTHDIVRFATQSARTLYKPGIKYRKAGVIATGLISESELQLNIFDEHDGGKRDNISIALDRINMAFGRGTIRMASEGYAKSWKLRHEYLSKGYTTRWPDIIKVI